MIRVKKKAAKKKTPAKRKRASKKPSAARRRAEVDPAAMSIETTARLLSTISEARITKEMVQADVDGGAPTNRDGTINIVHYTAWLARERAARR